MKTIKNTSTRLATTVIASKSPAFSSTANMAWQAAWSEYLTHRQQADATPITATLLATMGDVVATTRGNLAARKQILKATPEAQTYRQELSRLVRLAEWGQGIFGEAEKAPEGLDSPLTMVRAGASISTVYRAWSAAVRLDLRPVLTESDPEALACEIALALSPSETEDGRIVNPASSITVALACTVTLASGAKVQRKVALDLLQNRLLHTALIKALEMLAADLSSVLEAPVENGAEAEALADALA